MPLHHTAATTVCDSPSTEAGAEPQADRGLLIAGRLVTAARVFRVA